MIYISYAILAGYLLWVENNPELLRKVCDKCGLNYLRFKGEIIEGIYIQHIFITSDERKKVVDSFENIKYMDFEDYVIYLQENPNYQPTLL